MWPLPGGTAPGLERWERAPERKEDDSPCSVAQEGPCSSWPQFPHLYNGQWWGNMIMGSEDSLCPRVPAHPHCPTPHTDNSVLGQAKHNSQAPPSAHCADGDQMLQPCGSRGGGGRAQRAGRQALGLARGPIISSCPSDPGPGLTLGAVVSWPAVATAAIFGSPIRHEGGLGRREPPGPRASWGDITGTVFGPLWKRAQPCLQGDSFSQGPGLGVTRSALHS